VLQRHRHDVAHRFGQVDTASSLTFFASALKMSQSLFDSQQGGTAACSGWMKECMSVVLRSSFSYQVAVGRTMSE
jgi:hypothetical protein